MESPIGPLKRWQMSPEVQKTRGFAMIRYLEISHTELDCFSCISSNWPEINFESPTRLKVHLISFVTFTKSQRNQAWNYYVVSLDMWWRLISVIMVLIVYYHIQHIPTWHVIGFFMSFPSHSPVDLAPQLFCSSKVYSETSGDVTRSSSLVYDIYRFAKTNIIPFKRNNPIVNHIHHSTRCLWLICDWPLTFTTWVTHTHTQTDTWRFALPFWQQTIRIAPKITQKCTFQRWLCVLSHLPHTHSRHSNHSSPKAQRSSMDRLFDMEVVVGTLLENSHLAGSWSLGPNQCHGGCCGKIHAGVGGKGERSHDFFTREGCSGL